VAETVWLGFYVPDLTPAPPLYAPGQRRRHRGGRPDAGRLANKDTFPFGPTCIHAGLFFAQDEAIRALAEEARADIRE
jgi:hypothetical protein